MNLHSKTRQGWKSKDAGEESECGFYHLGFVVVALIGLDHALRVDHALTLGLEKQSAAYKSKLGQKGRTALVNQQLRNVLLNMRMAQVV